MLMCTPTIGWLLHTASIKFPKFEGFKAVNNAGPYTNDKQPCQTGDLQHWKQLTRSFPESDASGDDFPEMTQGAMHTALEQTQHKDL
jgi:hypothetical protein